MGKQKQGRKFMQTLEQKMFNYLGGLAHRRGCSLQDLIRAVIIPEWVDIHYSKPGQRRKKR